MSSAAMAGGDSGPAQRSGEPRGEGQPRHSRHVLRSAVGVLAVLAMAAGLWLARAVLLLGFVAILVAVVLSYPVAWAQRAVRRRGVAVIAVLLIGAGALGGLGAIAAGPISEETAAVLESAPKTLRRARAWLDRVQRGAGDHRQTSPEPGRAAEPAQLARAAEVALPAAVATVGTIIELVLVVVLAAFLVHEPDVYRRGMRRLVPYGKEEVFDALWARLRDGLRRWVGGILVSMMIMGALTAIGLLAVGVENWALLGALTFFGTFVPYVGAVASAIPGLLVAAGQSPRHLVLATAVYLGIHLVEGYLVQPFVMRRAVELKPALLLFGQAMFGAIFGVLGVVVATPAILCLQIAVEYLWTERRLGKPGRGQPAEQG